MLVISQKLNGENEETYLCTDVSFRMTNEDWWVQISIFCEKCHHFNTVSFAQNNQINTIACYAVFTL